MANAAQWQAWMALAAPEAPSVALPKELAGLTLFRKLLVVQALRPERVLTGLEVIVAQHLGEFNHHHNHNLNNNNEHAYAGQTCLDRTN
jgi:hypothetical protein